MKVIYYFSLSIILLVFNLSFVSANNNDEREVNRKEIIINDISIDRLKRAPVQLDVKDFKIIMEAYLWRDFMPIGPPEGKPLKVSIKLIAERRKEFPKFIEAKHLWVIKAEEIWHTTILKIQPPEYPNQKIIFAEDGPKWDPGTEVDVTILLKDKKSHEIYFLRSPNQIIQRTF